jgi:hypothetical protein
MTVTVDPPVRLPGGVERLSLSSIKLFQQCPIRWRRRYLEREYEPASGKMVLGSAAGAAESQHFSLVIETGEGLSVDDVLDEFSSEWEERIGREEVVFGSDKPGELKDEGARALELYHTLHAPLVVPVSVEREFRLSWPGLDWSLIGYPDLEEADGTVSDLKMKGRRISPRDADADLQPTVYLAARRAEGNPAPGFKFHTMVRGRKPVSEVVPTVRSDAQLDGLTDRVFGVAAEMVWRADTGNWSGAAPGIFRAGSDVCSGCRYMDCAWRLA